MSSVELAIMPIHIEIVVFCTVRYGMRMNSRPRNAHGANATSNIHIYMTGATYAWSMVVDVQYVAPHLSSGSGTYDISYLILHIYTALRAEIRGTLIGMLSPLRK